MAKIHHLKTWPQYFRPVVEGQKTFEYRINDRGFQEGDLLVLEELDPETQQYTGEREFFKVGFILAGGQFGLPASHCILSLVSPVGHDWVLLNREVYGS